MIIGKIQGSGTLTLMLEGKLDTTTAPQLQDALMSALDESQEVALDFTQLVYVSSAGLRVLLMGQKAANANGASMRLCGVSQEIMEVFEMTGFADMLTIV